MTHVSPTSLLLWAILCAVETLFLLTHLWQYDRFQSLKWSSGRQPGAFKRVMTYSYILCVPMIFVYSASLAAIKYSEGYMFIPGHGFIPKPYQLWSPDNLRWIVPVTIVFSVAWSLEIVSHLEELTFWLFLLNQGSTERRWFSSYEFYIWISGSVLAVGGMPVVTVYTRSDPLLMEAWTIFVGSIGSLLITLWFLVVLFKFPSFLRRVRGEGADAEVVVRLTMFNEINRVRIFFRFLFVLPLLTLSSEGIIPGIRHPVNENLLWTDFLVLVGGIGCVISSILTLLIFFPRSISKEAGYRSKTISLHSKSDSHQLPPPSPVSTFHANLQLPPPDTGNSSVSTEHHYLKSPTTGTPRTDDDSWYINAQHERLRGQYLRMKIPPKRPPRPPTPELHPLILSFMSPIDLLDGHPVRKVDVGRAV